MRKARTHYIRVNFVHACFACTKDILRQNEYEKLMKYCKYSKNKKDRIYIYIYLL